MSQSRPHLITFEHDPRRMWIVDFLPSTCSISCIWNDLVSRRWEIAKKGVAWTEISMKYWTILPENGPRYCNFKFIDSVGLLIKPLGLSQILEGPNYSSPNYHLATVLGRVPLSVNVSQLKQDLLSPCRYDLGTAYYRQLFQSITLRVGACLSFFPCSGLKFVDSET